MQRDHGYTFPVAVLISRNAAGAPRLSNRRLVQLARRMLAYLGCDRRELSILLCDDQLITKLNTRYRGQRKATDVLAFITAELGPKLAESQPLGDVVISLETARRQAVTHGASLFQETAFLLAHGILHLVGMDHDTPRNAAAMNQRTRALLRIGGLQAPRGVRALDPTGRASNRPKPRPKPRRGGTRRGKSILSSRT